MGFLQNTWVRYVDRTYQQIKNRVITQMQSRVPEITDHTEGNIFVKMLGIWGGIAEMLGYYVDNKGREAFIDSCRLYESAVLIAKGADYRIQASSPASAEFRFTLDVPAPVNITIPVGTVVATDNGTEFRTTQVGVIPMGATEVVVTGTQTRMVVGVNLGTATGNARQEIELDPNLVDGSLVLLVNGVGWQQVTTFGYSKPTDTHYVQSVNEKRIPILRLGNGVNGLIPVGASLVANYYVTLGAAGNVGAGDVNTIVSNLGLPVGVQASVANINRASGGGGVEDLQSLKKRIPLAIRTRDRAVTMEDYKDIAEQANGVALAGVTFDCGKAVDIYIVPVGGGVASVALRAATFNFISARKIIGTPIQVFSAGEVRVQQVVNIRVKASHFNAVTAALVQQRLANFVSYLHQSIRGTLYLSDLYEVVEGTEGVDNSDLVSITAVPYARPLNAATPQLNWNRTVAQNTNLAAVSYKIKMNSPTVFQLFRNNVFMGVFNVGVIYSDADISFVINSNYAINDTWEFFVYPTQGNLGLVEPSLPVSLASDIIVNATGGM